MKFAFLAAAGVVSLVAATAAFAQAPAPGAPMPPRHDHPKVDANGDGKITWAEFEAAALARFDAKDTNKDGRLTKEELMAGRPHRGHPPMAPDGAAPPPPPGAAPGEGPKDGKGMHGGMRRGMGAMMMMRRADLNDDGVISRDEADKAAKRLFTFLDINGDGVLSGKELPPHFGMHKEGIGMHKGMRRGMSDKPPMGAPAPAAPAQ